MYASVTDWGWRPGTPCHFTDLEMATRPLVSYDDITLPYQPSKPPQKKRKRNQQKSVSEEAFADPNDYEEEEESRELTHEEIWDDSALVNAWEAATEEYEAYHGSKKAWKTENVNKAPLYDILSSDETKVTNLIFKMV